MVPVDAVALQSREVLEEETDATLAEMKLGWSPGPVGLHPLVVKGLADILVYRSQSASACLL